MIKHITIDGRKIPFEEGQTIMDAAMAAGVYIPHLCHNSDYKPHGSCRLCTVKINDRHVASCITPATDGAVIENNCAATRKERQTLLKLLFVEGNHVCPACEKSGACQLQAVAYYCGMLAPEFTHFYPKRSIDASHPDYIIDFNRCIMCDLCVRASHIKDDKDIFSISGRGINAHLIINSPSGKLGDTNFSKEDKAAHVCPVGAIMPKHKGYSVPIGERLYDRKPVSMVGDVTDNLDD